MSDVKEKLDDILEWFNKSDLTSAKVEWDEKGGFSVKLSRAHQSGGAGHVNAMSVATPTQGVSERASSTAQMSESSSSSESSENSNGQHIQSPIVGTFYRSSNPDTPPFIQVGDKIKKGQILCIIEAMKVMNELEAEFDMEIVSILAENSKLVEFDEPLFEVIPL